jgi:hypothetical protein
MRFTYCPKYIFGWPPRISTLQLELFGCACDEGKE